MPMTLEQLRSQLSAIEPDERMYQGIGPSEIPLLEQLLQDEEPWMASRAVFALSRIPHPEAMRILSQVTADPRPEVRVSLAASARNMPPQAASDILLNLLDDADVGVRKFSVDSIAPVHNKAVHAKLKEIEGQDPSPAIRKMARTRMEELDDK